MNRYDYTQSRLRQLARDSDYIFGWPEVITVAMVVIAYLVAEVQL